MAKSSRPSTVVVLGSTGSIGTQAEQVIRAHPARFRAMGLAAGGNQVEVLARQILDLTPEMVAVAKADAVPRLVAEISRQARGRGKAVPHPDIAGGAAAVRELAGVGAGIVLNAMTGSIGLGPTLAALAAGSTVALANKESLVAGGALVRHGMRREDQVVPVDSEHSAIAQALRAGARGEVARLILTASGGPFRGWTRDRLARATPAQALAHPTWSMGPVVSVNSATMVNKALELIEAHVLFELAPEQIDVVVHPQSVVHSMVEFVDGATIAQASPPDMRLPIALGLAWPDRLTGVVPPVDFTAPQAWTFEPLDAAVFPAVNVARAALAASALHPAVFNAANEVAVGGFLAGRVGFAQIVETVTAVLDDFGPVEPQISRALACPGEGEIAAAEDWARVRAASILGVADAFPPNILPSPPLAAPTAKGLVE
ncbi:MAG: 1-deoxy-D-xylulose-5-phosphate reductoisomerase [Bifidobacteriaceae bacterium]|nr:1-deoxy-D-xylulose-5-phosphate reductoisomerase [Bifidobacteriaceae bacterium]